MPTAAAKQTLIVTKDELTEIAEWERKYAKAKKAESFAEKGVKFRRLHNLPRKLSGSKPSGTSWKALTPDQVNKLAVKRLEAGDWKLERGAPDLRLQENSTRAPTRAGWISTSLRLGDDRGRRSNQSRNPDRVLLRCHEVALRSKIFLRPVFPACFSEIFPVLSVASGAAFAASTGGFWGCTSKVALDLGVRSRAGCARFRSVFGELCRKRGGYRGSYPGDQSQKLKSSIHLGTGDTFHQRFFVVRIGFRRAMTIVSRSAFSRAMKASCKF